MKKALVSLFVALLLLSAVVPAVAKWSIQEAGYIVFLDEHLDEISSIQVNRVAVEDLNRAVGYLDDTALVVWDKNASWQPTFYVSELPENAVFLKWTDGYNESRWVIVTGVQTELKSKLYVPAKTEAGLIRDDNYCDESLLCTSARNGW